MGKNWMRGQFRLFEECCVDTLRERAVFPIKCRSVEEMRIDADSEGRIGVSDELRHAVDVDSAGDQLRREVVAAFVECMDL